MRKLCVLLSIFIFLSSSIVNAQSVGINTTGNAPDASAMLDVSSPTKGLLIPRVQLTATNSAGPITSPGLSLLVYNTVATSGANGVTPGFYFWNGTAWEKLSSNAWLTGGNAGTDATTNFIGTTDDQALVFKVRNVFSGVINRTHLNTALGYSAFASNTSGTSNTAFGSTALFLNTLGSDNTATGNSALSNNVTGSFNTALGSRTLFSNTGSENTATGNTALYGNTSGSYNTALGSQTLLGNGTGSYNTAVGYQADVNFGNLTNATAIGYNAHVSQSNSIVLGNNVNVGIGTPSPNTTSILDLTSNSRGLLIPRMSTEDKNAISSPATGLLVYDISLNSFYYYNGTSWAEVGSGASANAWQLSGNTGTDASNFIGTTDDQPLIFKSNNTLAGQVHSALLGTANNNVSFGLGALNSTVFDSNNPSLGNFNVAIGNEALFYNSTGSHNVAVGLSALTANTTGTQNTATGSYTLQSNTEGFGNTAVGYAAMSTNTTGIDNTAIGGGSLYTNLTGSYNTAVGISSLKFNQAGSSNTAVGYAALLANTADANTAIGHMALSANTTGSRNTASGVDALYVNTTGSDNTATGLAALQSNTTGSLNTATGNQALLSNTEGFYNAAHGYQALFLNTTGTYNTAIGSGALVTNTEGLHNTALGSFADVTIPNLVNATAIGYNAKVSQSNSMVLGENVNVGIGTSSPNSSSLLELSSDSKGLLIPRMSTTERNAISSPATGLLVYDNSLNSFYYYNGSSWAEIGGSASSTGWLLNGNAGTDPETQFIGTTDAQPLLFRVNNISAGQIQVSNTNTGFGLGTLASTTGDRNTAIGQHALYTNTTGNNNTAIGVETLYSNTTGLYNSAFGEGALYANTTGENNTGTGGGALNANTTGNENTATGHAALLINTTGSWNTANGSAALLLNTTGIGNTASGYSSLRSNTTGGYNTSYGYQALYTNSTGTQNTANGVEALYNNNSGYSNTANGFRALYFNTTGYLNSANGYFALHSNTGGHYNTANGDGAMSNNTSGSYNSANGATTLFSNSTGSYNTASGFESLYSNNESYNTAFGAYALHNTTASQYNTAVGYSAGTNYNNGYNNVFLGANTDVDGDGYYNVIAIGQATVCTGSSQVTMGNPATGSYRAYAAWSNISDGRYKKNIREDVPGLAFINKLRPVTYNLDASGLDVFLHRNQPEEKQMNGVAKERMNKALKEKEQLRFTGFVAQEVEQASKQLGFNFSGIDAPKNEKDLYGLRYSEFVVPLVKAVQEQQAIIEKLQQQVDALTKTVQALSSNK